MKRLLPTGARPECGAQGGSGGSEPFMRSARPKWSEAQSASLGMRKGEPAMKKVLFALVATLVAVSVSGCAGLGKGKGKAPPPPPIVRKG